jgi:hypothetical protein
MAQWEFDAKPLRMPKDDFSDTIPVKDWLAAPVCPFHEVPCSELAERRAEYAKAADAFEAAEIDHELRPGTPPAVGSASFSGRHFFYFKLDRGGLTYRAGQMRDLTKYDDYIREP